MHSDQDITSARDFIHSTPENSLRKMLVGGELTEVHFRLLMKLVKGSPVAEFITLFQTETLPKIRLSPAEIKIKEHFWPVCKKKLSAMGLLNLSGTAKAA
jgi:hypothetical protein